VVSCPVPTKVKVRKKLKDQEAEACGIVLDHDAEASRLKTRIPRKKGDSLNAISNSSVVILIRFLYQFRESRAPLR